MTFMTWNLMHLGWMLKQAGGIPAHGNQPLGVGRRLPVRLREPGAPVILLRRAMGHAEGPPAAGGASDRRYLVFQPQRVASCSC
jgi:hypothetical protein